MKNRQIVILDITLKKSSLLINYYNKIIVIFFSFFLLVINIDFKYKSNITFMFLVEYTNFTDAEGAREFKNYPCKYFLLIFFF